MHVIEYTKLCQGVLLDTQFHSHFHESDHSLDSRQILCCGVGISSKNPFSVGREQIMDKYVMYKCMELSSSSCNVRRIIVSLSGRVETMKRHDETKKRQNDKRRQTDVVSDESNSLNEESKRASRQIELTRWRDELTKWWVDFVERRVELAIWRSRTRKTTTRLEVSACRHDETPYKTKRRVEHFFQDLPSYRTFSITMMVHVRAPCS